MDGTLLTSDKNISAATRNALEDMHNRGVEILLASGRIGSSMLPYAQSFSFPLSMLTLNGATVYHGLEGSGRLIHAQGVPAEPACDILQFAEGKSFALNIYADGKLYSITRQNLDRWTGLYKKETNSEYTFVESYESLMGISPSKLLMIGDPKELDKLQEQFQTSHGSALYIVRTWDYYLEFMHPAVNKGSGIESFAAALGLELSKSIVNQ